MSQKYNFMFLSSAIPEDKNQQQSPLRRRIQQLLDRINRFRQSFRFQGVRFGFSLAAALGVGALGLYASLRNPDGVRCLLRVFTRIAPDAIITRLGQGSCVVELVVHQHSSAISIIREYTSDNLMKQLKDELTYLGSKGVSLKSLSMSLFQLIRISSEEFDKISEEIAVYLNKMEATQDWKEYGMEETKENDDQVR